MKKRETFSPAAVGSSSLLVIFAVLCLTVFALLSLSSAQAERRIADAATQAVVDYYEADLRAEEILARLRNGEQVNGLEETEGNYCFEVPVSQRQILAVTLTRRENEWVILQRQTVTVEEMQNGTLNIWKGSEDTP